MEPVLAPLSLRRVRRRDLRGPPLLVSRAVKPQATCSGQLRRERPYIVDVHRHASVYRLRTPILLVSRRDLRRPPHDPAGQGGAVPAGPLPAGRREHAGQGSPDSLRHGRLVTISRDVAVQNATRADTYHYIHFMLSL